MPEEPHRSGLTTAHRMSGSSISDQLASAFARHGSAVALLERASGRELTYDELDQLSAGAFRTLRHLGVPPGGVVALEATRSPDVVVALVGILRSGATVLPFRGDEPPLRRQAMFEDAAVDLVVADDRWVPELDGLPCLSPDALLHPPDIAPAYRHVDVDPGSCAYILFTSGSTGRPKGVAMPHRALGALVDWHLRSDGAGEGRRTAQVTPLTFDVSFQEIFTALCSGRMLVILPESCRRDPSALLDEAFFSGVDRLFLPTALLPSVAEAGLARDVQPPLADVIVAGSALTVSRAVREWFALLSSARLHNHYGPTETHVVTALTLGGDPATWPEVPPIGQPLPHVRLDVVGPSGESLPAGARGQLVVEGPCVALGYVAQPDAAERLFRSEAGGPVRYWTGDICSVSGGQYWYHGREDRQVKVRGHRVELSEVEVAIMEMPSVRGCAVVPHLGTSSTERLVAYVVHSPPDQPTNEPAWLDGGAFRDALASQLPAHMIPSIWIGIDSIPLTDNGKVDAPALPDPRRLMRVTSRSRSARVDDLESLVASVIGTVLGVPPPDADERLLDLGATSLDMTRIAARLTTAVRRTVTVADVLRSPTVSAVARTLRSGTGPEPGPDPEEVQRPRTRGTPTLSQVQQAFRVTELMSPGNEMNIVVSAHFFRSAPRPEPLRAALADVLARHELLSTGLDLVSGRTFDLSPDRPVLRHDRVRTTEREVHDVLTRLVHEERTTPIDLLTGGLRTRLVDVAPFGTLLLLSLHHVVFDGWSELVLLEDLRIAYDARLGGRAPRWARHPTPYARFVDAESMWLRTAAATRERAWWVHQLRDVLDLDLPGTAPRSAPRSLRATTAGHRRIAAPAALLGLTALAEGLRHGLDARGPVALGLVVSGRTSDEHERAIGPFLNTVCVPVVLTDEPVTHDAVAPSFYAALDHARLPFSQVVTALGRRPARMNPLCQVVHVSQDSGPVPLRLGGVTAARLDPGQHPHPFHLVAQTWSEGADAVLQVDAVQAVPRGVLDGIERAWRRSRSTCEEL